MNKLSAWLDRLSRKLFGPHHLEEPEPDPKPRLRPDNPTNQLFHEVKPTPGLGPTPPLPPEEQP